MYVELKWSATPIYMSSIIGNDHTNKQWAMVNVVLYSKKKELKFVKYKISKLTVEKTITKKVIDFLYIRLPIVKYQ